MAAAAAAAVAHQAGDDEVAMKEVAQVYELIKTHQPLLLLHHNSQQQQQQLAYSLLTEAMRALNVALSVMKHLPSSPAPAAIPVNMIKPEVTPASSSTATAADGGDNQVGGGKPTRRSAAKRRRINGEDKSSCFQLTTMVPHEDGYQWRKYGEKKIQGTDFT
uniref:WRKY domain-containing protein n=2 Tax=Oryza brachyantha TaxID=4533 RepID=J3NAU2_ORYBR